MKKNLFLVLIVLTSPFFLQAQVNVTTSVVPSSVELIWESHAYAPPLYPGKVLYPAGGEVTVLALPDASLGSPNTLSYTWKKDGVIDGKKSGVGKQSYIFSGSQFGESPLIAVEISNGTRIEFGATRITQTAPFIHFYENKPLQGIAFESALPRSITTKERTFSVEAYPYFFSTPSRENGNIRYTWNTRGILLPEAKTGALSVQTEEPGVIDVQLSISNTKEILQQATESLAITFDF